MSISGHSCVFGLGWGDEGKGKVVDLLCPVSDLVVRFNGGANAGHTVCVGDEKFALHLLPSGILHERIESVVGPGVVIDTTALLGEIDALTSRGMAVDQRLRISDRAHLVLAYHKIEDALSERDGSDGRKIGTTSRGIGPCYADKMRRTSAVRVGDLAGDERLEDRVARIMERKRTMLVALYGEDGDLDVDAVLSEIRVARQRLAPMITDTTAFLHGRMQEGKRILFEGANGMLLDVDHGTYPFVTSSSTGAHGVGAGAGVPPQAISRSIGVTKAYATRVGEGPFVTELRDATGDRIRVRGNEFGTTTGRPRRCGWFDAVVAGYSARLGGVTDVALMHLDTLAGFDKIGVCSAYRLDGERLTMPPAQSSKLDRCEPEFEYLPGWQEDLRAVRRFEDLPSNARAYVGRIEELIGVEVSLISVGPDRTETIVRNDLVDVLAETSSEG